MLGVSEKWPFQWVDDMEVSLNGGTPKSSILMGFYLINHPFGDPPFMETHMFKAEIPFMETSIIIQKPFGHIHFRLPN